MKFSKKILLILVVVVLLFLVLFSWRFVQVASQEFTQKNYDLQELKSQNDFKLIGDIVYLGGGFEPGWNFKLTLVDNKFGVELVSKYGETKYVGYLGLVAQSTTTKTWTGNVLDINNIVQNMQMEILNKKCTEPSGDEVDYTITVKVSDENLDGCAKLAM